MFNLIKEYAYKRVDLLKLQAAEKAGSVLGTVVFVTIILFCAFFFVLLLLFGIGFLIGTYLNNYGYVLLIVAGFFLLVLIVIFLLRNTIKNKVAIKIFESIDN